MRAGREGLAFHPCDDSAMHNVRMHMHMHTQAHFLPQSHFSGMGPLHPTYAASLHLWAVVCCVPAGQVPNFGHREKEKGVQKGSRNLES